MRPLPMLLCSLTLTAGSVLGLAEESVWDRVVGGFGVVFFGFGAVVSALSLHRDRPQTLPPPSPLPDEVRRQYWFFDNDPEEDEENDFTSAEAAFLDGLRDKARSLPAGGSSSIAVRRGDAMVAGVCLDGPTHLLDFGVHVTYGLIRGDRLHNQRYQLQLPDEPSSLALTATGSDDELIDRAVEWMEAVLRRPVERAEWWHKGTQYAVRYQFADTREGMIEAFDRKRAPRGLYKELLAAGSVHVGNLIETSGIGEPDATVAVRADGRLLPTPGLPYFLWYECPLRRGRAKWHASTGGRSGLAG